MLASLPDLGALSLPQPNSSPVRWGLLMGLLIWTVTGTVILLVILMSFWCIFWHQFLGTVTGTVNGTVNLGPFGVGLLTGLLFTVPVTVPFGRDC